jgi:Ca2+-binding EF-hand superfamily protein
MISGIGGVSATEMWQALLKKADTNGDGAISKSEFGAIKPKDGPGPDGEDMFSKIDSNGDGYITQDENAAFISSMKPPSASQMFSQADTNGDGQLTKEELSAVAPKDGKGPSTDQVFSQMDTNKDGVVSQAEYQAFMEKMEQNAPDQTDGSTVSALA